MINVLIVDDSAVVRKVLSEQLEKNEDIKVVGSAIDPYVAREKILTLQPDVITLDLEMPRMNGLVFLDKLMKYYPIPVIVVSSLTPKNSEAAIKALELGAVEVICKPGSTFSTPDAQQLVRAVRAAAASNIRKRIRTQPSEPTNPITVDFNLKTTHKVIAIGASTGGTQAIEAVLKGFPSATPGTVIVQHMPENFTKAFANRLNTICHMEVREAKDNDSVVPGVALIAPGNHHLLLHRSGARYHVRLKDGPPVHHQRPAVDVLFHSVAHHVGQNAIGVLLTGMGADGAKGLLAMHDSGSFTIAQDEKTSIVFGMPKEAINLGAADKILPLDRISAEVLNWVQAEEKPR